MKTCPQCETEKPAEDFYKNRAKKDGLSSECKSCTRAAKKDYYARNREKVQARTRAWREAHPEEAATQRKRWREENPGRRRESEIRYRRRKGMDQQTTLADRLVEAEVSNGCRIWPVTDKQGYGHWNGKTAHRAVAEAAGVALPDRDHHFHHTCKNRACVNLAHLRIVDAAAHKALHKEEAPA